MAVFGLLTLHVLVLSQFARVCHSVNMVWGVKENHVGVIALRNCGGKKNPILNFFKLLKPLKISRMLIYRATEHFKELWRVEDTARSGRLKGVRDESAIKTVRERTRNGLTSANGPCIHFLYRMNFKILSNGTG